MKALYDAKIGKVGAKNRAQTVLGDKTVDPKTALENLTGKGLITEEGELQGAPKFVPGFFDLLGPGPKTQDEGVINLFTAFIREDERLAMSESLKHQELSDLIMEVARSAVDDIPLTQQTVKQGLKGLKDVLARRIALTEERLAVQIAEIESPILQAEAHRMGLKLIMAEKKFADNTVDQAWGATDLSVKTTTFPAMTTWEELLRRVGDAEGGNLLNLDKGGQRDLYKLLGHLEPFQGFSVGKSGVAERVNLKRFVPGTLGKETSMRNIQDIRSRVARAIRKERLELVPDGRRIGLLEQLEDGLLASQGALDTDAMGPLTSQAMKYLYALNATRIVKAQFGGELGEIIKIRKGGNVREASTTLENIFAGAGKTGGAKGAAIIDEIITRMQGETNSPRAQELLAVFEELFKQRFAHFAVEGGTVNVSKARAFMKNHAQQLIKLQNIRADLEKVIETGDTTLLRVTRFKAAEKRINDHNINMSIIMTEQGPYTMFNEMVKEKPKRLLNQQIAKVLRDVNRDPTGRAREGLKGSLLMWMINLSTHNQISNLHNPTIISGATLRRVWGIESVQVIAKKIWTKKDFARMDRVLRSADLLDEISLAKPTMGGSFDLEPNRLIENLLRIQALDRIPIGSSGGGGSLAQKSILSNFIKEQYRKFFKMHAHQMLKGAFESEDTELLEALFMDVVTPEDAKFVIGVARGWLGAALAQIGERSLNEDDEDEQ